MKKKNKKGQHIVVKSDNWAISKYLGQKSERQKPFKEHSNASIKRYSRVVKEGKQVVRSSQTGKFVSITHEPSVFKGSKIEKARNRAVRSSTNPKTGTRIGGPKRN